MGRSRAVPHATDEDPSLSRSKRKRTASNVENLEPASTGPGMSEGKMVLYHCNYCIKDISRKIRIKCADCLDFDLCVECFSVGAEVTPHKNSHPYRVMDLSHFMVKNKEELLAMAKEQGDVKNGFPTLGDVTVKEEIPLSMRIKGEDQRKDVHINSGSGVSFIKATKRTSQAKDIHENIKKEEKKPKLSGEEKHKLNLEQLLADMEFKKTDTDAQIENKLRVLRMYSKK